MGSGLIEAKQKVHILRNDCFRPNLIGSICQKFDFTIEMRAEGPTAQQALANLSKGIQCECDSSGIMNYGKGDAVVSDKVGQPITAEVQSSGPTRGPIAQFFHDLFN